MGFTYSTYFGLARVNNTGPEAQNWAVTDYNPELSSKLMYALSRHTHTSATPLRFPGYRYNDPAATPVVPLLGEVVTATPAGILAPGTTLAVRLAYEDSYGLETDASPEARLTLGTSTAAADPPDVSTPILINSPSGMTGGVYVYGITKLKGTSETELSNVAVIEVPFSTDATKSYNVNVTFDPIAEYSDGTDSLNIYRATGLNSTFQLLKKWTDNTVGPATPVSYLDTGALEDATKTPPAVNTFDRNKSLEINLRPIISTAGATPPADARILKVYVTQTPGVYGTNSLFEEIDLTTPTGPDPATPIKNLLHFLGSENLQPEYPKDFTQILTPPGKLNLKFETYGAPVLTENMDFNGFSANNLVLPSALGNATPITGGIYYDSGTSSIKFYTGSTWSTLSVTGGYTHSENEPGGHSADRIYNSVNNAGGTKLTDLMDIIATPVPKGLGKRAARKVVQPVYRSTYNPSETDAQTTSTTLTDLISGVGTTIVPEFAGQWLEVNFNGSLFIDPQNAKLAIGSIQLEINNNAAEGQETYRSFSTLATPVHVPVSIYFATPISTSVSSLKVRWLVTAGGKMTAFALRRQLYAKLLF